jgi:hypothetical protein
MALLYTNISTVHSPLFYKHASRSSQVAGMASTNKKRLAVLRDEEEVGEYLLLSESEESLSDSEFDTDNEMDDHALLDVVVNNGRNEDDSIRKTLFGRTRKTKRDKEKISLAVLDLKALQNN